MDFTAWLQAKGIPADGLNENAKIALQAQWRVEQNPAPAPQPAPQPAPAPTPAPQPARTSAPSGFDATVAAIEAETARQDYIRERTEAHMKANVGNREKIEQFKVLCQSALTDQKIDRNQFDLALMRLDHSRGPLVFATSKPQMADDVLEAAVCMTTRIPGHEKQFSDQTLQAARSQFKRGIGLKELLSIAAERNGGYRGTTRDIRAMCKAAFSHGDGDVWQTIGASTINVGGILSNVANKSLSSGFLFTEQAWRDISRIRSANDYKQMTSYRLAGDAKFQKIAPSGEIKHGTLSEVPYTNKVDPYGLMLGISEVDIRNDDIGAFTQNGLELGRGAGTSLNEVFWAEFTDDATFFSTDNDNLIADTANAVFSIANLGLADVAFRIQTKEDGTPLGVMPKILLVAAGHRIAAENIVNSTVLGAATTAVTATANAFAGAYKVVSSVYLHAVLSTLWYLLADPMDIPVMDVAFLDGRDTPMIETADFDFDRLGVAMRGTMSFGCSKVEFRGGYKSNGEGS